MKKTKTIFSLLLTLMMILGLATTAFAAGAGSITISNATKGETYSVYKVFDLTYDGDAVAYSYTKTGDTDALYAALAGDASPFTLTATTTANVYNVSLKAGKTAADISSFLTTNLELLGAPTATQENVTANTVAFTGLDYGYYYVTSSLGAIVTLDSAKPDVTIIDKNQKPGWDPEDPEEPDGSGEVGKFVAAAADSTYAKTSTAAIDDTAYFKINVYAPKYAGDKLVSTYKFVDTLGDGFTYNNDLKVTLNGVELTADSDYTLSVSGQVLTIVVNAGTISNYPVEGHLSITYTATVDKDAVYDNVNTAAMSWTVYPNNEDGDPIKDDPQNPPYDPNDPSDPSNDPKDPEKPGDTTTHTYVFGFNIQKYKEDVGEDNKLLGAKFRLYDAEEAGNEIPVVLVKAGEYRVAQAGETGVEIEAGAAKIFGLDAKIYYLEETVAPNGYNILTERVAVAISADSTAQTEGILNATIDIINNAGALLPSTGGMGTTLFYVLGGLMVAGAVVLLITKKRMSRAEN